MFVNDAILEHMNTRETATCVNNFCEDTRMMLKDCKELFQVMAIDFCESDITCDVCWNRLIAGH